ncbi:hypothetical protein HYQ44_003656 [Verticillium longisporum]|nr:hypothetical protein HYQ44_003656 [Verticillium longisporum]
MGKVKLARKEDGPEQVACKIIPRGSTEDGHHSRATSRHFVAACTSPPQSYFRLGLIPAPRWTSGVSVLSFTSWFVVKSPSTTRIIQTGYPAIVSTFCRVCL